MDEMQKRQIYTGLGMLLLAAALAVPAFARPREAGPAWMGGWMGRGQALVQGGAPVTSLDAAAARARDALAAYGGGDLMVAEVMEFSNHYYVLVKEQSTKRGALELIVERSGIVRPEPGPNMMWNTKYGHMAGTRGYGPGRMMGGGYGPGGMMRGRRYGGWPGSPAAQPVTQARARQLAAEYLAREGRGDTPDGGVALYGYFTFDVERGGTPVGMLSVHGSSGQIWYHTWHGTFVAEKDYEEGAR